MWFGGLVVCSFGGFVVWWFSVLVVLLFCGFVVWWFGGSVVGGLLVLLFDCVWWFCGFINL